MNKKKKICILGKLPSKFYAPFNDTSWEIWSMNKHKDEMLIPRVDKWFDLHKIPVKPDADILRDDFPMEECFDLVGGHYFNNTSSFLVAYAILQGATDIALYGMRFDIDHSHRQAEYYNMRELIFFAKGRGINITSYEEVLMAPYVYKATGDFDS
jgi:hypothetical protein